jgi:hypothetical protein
MPALQNAVMDQTHNRLKNSGTDDQFDEFAHIAYSNRDGEHALGKVLRAALAWCEEETLVCYVDTLPNKLVLQMMLIFKNFLGARRGDCKTMMEVVRVLTRVLSMLRMIRIRGQAT